VGRKQSAKTSNSSSKLVLPESLHTATWLFPLIDGSLWYRESAHVPHRQGSIGDEGARHARIRVPSPPYGISSVSSQDLAQKQRGFSPRGDGSLPSGMRDTHRETQNSSQGNGSLLSARGQEAGGGRRMSDPGRCQILGKEKSWSPPNPGKIRILEIATS